MRMGGGGGGGADNEMVEVTETHHAGKGSGLVTTSAYKTVQVLQL